MINKLVSMAITSVLFWGVAGAQMMKIHTNDVVKQFQLSEIDSITFEFDEQPGSEIGKLRLTNGVVAGWSENTEYPYTTFTASNLFNLINGGAQEFVDRGMKEGFRQGMTNGPDKTFTSLVMDFGTAENALNMYTLKLQQFMGTKETAGAFPENQAFVNTSTSGYEAYGVFGNVMVVIWMDGYGTDKSEAKADAVLFLEAYKNKIDLM